MPVHIPAEAPSDGSGRCASSGTRHSQPFSKTRRRIAMGSTAQQESRRAQSNLPGPSIHSPGLPAVNTGGGWRRGATLRRRVPRRRSGTWPDRRIQARDRCAHSPVMTRRLAVARFVRNGASCPGRMEPPGPLEGETNGGTMPMGEACPRPPLILFQCTTPHATEGRTGPYAWTMTPSPLSRRAASLPDRFVQARTRKDATIRSGASFNSHDKSGRNGLPCGRLRRAEERSLSQPSESYLPATRSRSCSGDSYRQSPDWHRTAIGGTPRVGSTRAIAP